ncbi:RelA/SpoT domain-containing protein [Methylosinus sp. H3A]|uniref:RelA/SpoT domain-containing protein n=1 Tax=Methylosinus sp. H3A TaxID=2785786 RepID=UPI0018C2368D|nr:RelA/SpoT domain-containing protein [Methylosinus sp. H3A]MBG0810080.1 RelA/SpoT domain-containing protein [Methylosinus sp. H3A]
MNAIANVTPPWGTKGKVNKAGVQIRAGELLSDEEANAFESWRAGHSYVLNTFKPLLWSRTRGKEIIVAQRLKRRSTIIDKLFREPGMELARMDDIAGCRLIFKDINSLAEFRKEFHRSRFNHKLRHENPDKYNYILKPKDSGYRGVHEIYIYNVNTDFGRRFNGLYIEMQFRTLCQHAWATAVEVVSRVTENQPKFNRGDDRHREFFRLASEILARTEENLTSCRSNLSDHELCKMFKKLDSEINVMRFLRTLPVIEQASRIKNNVVLQLSITGKLILHKYSNIDSATEGYFNLEKQNPDDDIVLVRAKTFGDIRSAYRNYFQNTNEFIKYIEAGIKKLEKSK